MRLLGPKSFEVSIGGGGTGVGVGASVGRGGATVGIDGLALGLFRSHILGGTGDLANAREERTLTSSGNAEVGQACAMAR